jgi:hypothetical protein
MKMTKAEVSQIVMMVLNTNQNEVSPGDLSRKIVDLGVDPKDAPSILDAINTGFKAGTLAVVTGGMSAEGYAPGQNPFFDLAFRKGKAAMRFTTPFWVLMKFLAPFLIGAAVVGAILWKVLR